MGIVDDIRAATEKVTKKWTAQRKREERHASARLYRDEYMEDDRPLSITEVAEKIIPKAYESASDHGRLPAHARQIYYAARSEIETFSGRHLNSVYFTQTLLPSYMNRHPETEAWWVVYDPRGHIAEPHTKREIPLGTLAVSDYLAEIQQHEPPALEIDQLFEKAYPTCGPKNRYAAILFIEKEGFNPLFKEVKLAERYDLAIMSTKGQSVVAARHLVDQLCADGLPLLVLHDFDKEGFLIAQRLTTVSQNRREDQQRYQFENDVNVIDLGLRLEDVQARDLESEYVHFKGGFDSDTIATPEEQQFLRENKRVELNAFTSADLITWIEGKLQEHGIQKVVPDSDILEEAYRRALQIKEFNSRVEEIFACAAATAENATVPADLETQIRQVLEDAPERSWDAALAEIVARNSSDDSAC